ncbi:biopolymer transporter ExbD [Methylosinus sp. R-45379]|uniref:ExbD/TolR family protein n=1 Tax=unclassified Methylosinus TaxID=2624500 RepID=UPI0004651078|nr:MULTISPECIES: biopolymer transporter ExbD [unclassified Methylosinus]OAI30659.1 biopolymer transporter ExbD [Methylosinus sp. R-45379]TDX67206.1 biopolymer transport protein ExbD/biopolymer transport protein TolR [Methylosinus sp. sav-2]
MAFSAKRGSGGFQPLADINVTPLVDVMLVLLVIFMITAPMMAQGMKVDLPQARSAKPVNPKEPVVITVAKDGRLMLGPDEIPLDRIVEAVRAKINGDLSHVIHLRGDKESSLGDLVTLMDALSSNGMTHIAILSMQAKHAKAEAKGAAK